MKFIKGMMEINERKECVWASKGLKKKRKETGKTCRTMARVLVVVVFLGGFGCLFGSVLLVVWIAFPGHAPAVTRLHLRTNLFVMDKAMRA